MFRKLRIKITLSTFLILLVLLISLGVSIYQIAKIQFTKSIDIMLKESAYKVIFTGDFNRDFYYDFPFEDKFFFDRNYNNKIKINYFVYNEDLKAEYMKSNDLDLINDLKAQALEALETKIELYNTINVEGINYRVYSSFFKNFKKIGVIQVYRSIEMQDILLNNLLKVLIYSGLISLIILSGISYIVAGKYIKPIKSAWQKQKAFTEDASHELRTPLTVIKTNLDAATYDVDSKIRDNKIWFDNINYEINNLKGLIDELLLLAKGDNVDIRLSMKELNLSKVIEKSIDNYYTRFKEKNIKIEENIEKNIIIKGDKTKIRQLINILLDNAIKYNHQNGRIYIELSKEKKYTILQIKDNGIGIKKEDIDKIFDRFYRGDKARNRKEGGSGLGLSIAKWIIEKHGGKINIESKENVETKVSVYFQNN